MQITILERRAGYVVLMARVSVTISYSLRCLTTETEKYIQWGKKVFSQPPIVQVLPLKKMREASNFHHRYTSTMRDKINHIIGFFKNLFANYGGK